MSDAVPRISAYVYRERFGHEAAVLADMSALRVLSELAEGQSADAADDRHGLRTLADHDFVVTRNGTPALTDRARLFLSVMTGGSPDRTTDDRPPVRKRSRTELLAEAARSSMKADPPRFAVGDTIDVHTRITEGGKERIQVFSGTVLMRRGQGINETFTVRRIVGGEGVERIFPVHTPMILKVVVRRSGQVRRAKLFYLRDRVGKATRLKEVRATGRIMPRRESDEAKVGGAVVTSW